MNAQKLLEFAKVNGGVAVAFVLGYAYISKLETRLEIVENKLYDCYQGKAIQRQQTTNDTYQVEQLVAILPEKQKLYEYTSEN